MSLRSSKIIYIFLDILSLPSQRYLYEQILGLEVIENEFHPPHYKHGIIKYDAGDTILSLNLTNHSDFDMNGLDGLLIVFETNRQAEIYDALNKYGYVTLENTRNIFTDRYNHLYCLRPMPHIFDKRKSDSSIREIHLHVKDMQQSVIFYTEILGLVLLDQKNPKEAVFDTGNNKLIIREENLVSNQNPIRYTGYLIVFHTKDIKKTYSGLKDRGLNLTKIGFSEIGGTSRFEDPTGHRFCLYEPSEECLNWGSGPKVKEIISSNLEQVHTMTNYGYELLSNQLSENYKLELQTQGENLNAIICNLPLENVKRILDVGCGSGSLARAVAGACGPNVVVCGIDASAKHVEYAKAMAKKLNLSNIHFFAGDIFNVQSLHEVLREGQFDLIYCRYLLMYMVPKKQEEIFFSQMKRCGRRGSKLVCIEADVNFGQERFPSPSPILSSILSEIVEYYRQQELIEWRCGIQLYHHLRSAGLCDVEVKLVDGRIIQGGFPKQLVEFNSMDAEQLIQPILKSLGKQELVDEVALQWRQYLADPKNFLYTPIFMGIGTI